MSRRQMKSDAITAALHGQGYGGVEADVDREGICYLSGDVLSAEEEAAAVDLAYAMGAELVEDGLFHPGQRSAIAGHLYHAVPYSAHLEPDVDAARRVLGASELNERVFDAAARTSNLRTGSTWNL